VHKHDGFLLRLAAGPGFGSQSYDGEDFTYTREGPAMVAEIAVGVLVFENFAAHVSAWYWHIGDTVVSDGHEAHWSDDTLTAIGGGIGATYFIMPWNVYLTAGFGATDLSRGDPEGYDMETTPVLAARAAAGKEWWVSDNWGLGFAVAYDAAVALLNEGGEGMMEGSSIGLLLSATYN